MPKQQAHFLAAPSFECLAMRACGGLREFHDSSIIPAGPAFEIYD
ncbi:hypothetical protein [Paraburkholderia ultramafica]|nr:hypothetical protein [Paraburkholderia ultramafica]